MHFFDIIGASVAAIFLIIGIKRGFISEVFRLAALILGFICAVVFYPELYPKLAFLPTPPPVTTAIAFLSVYVTTAIFLLAIGWIVRKIVHLAMLGIVDRLLGGLTGLFKAALLLWVFLLAGSLAPESLLLDRIDSSMIYMLYSKIPYRLTVPDSREYRKYYDGLLESPPVKKLKEAGERLGSRAVTDTAGSPGEGSAQRR